MEQFTATAQNYYQTVMPLDFSCLFYNKKYFGGLLLLTALLGAF